MNSAKIRAIIEEVCQKVGGDWLLLGGSLVQLEYDGGRATEDIDLVQIRHSHHSEVRAQDELFKAAHRQGLDPEQVNSAAKFFISELKGWESEILPLAHGPAGRVFKPTLTLFVATKLRRASEIDQQDVIYALEKEGRASFDEEKFRALVGKEILANFEIMRVKLGL